MSNDGLQHLDGALAIAQEHAPLAASVDFVGADSADYLKALGFQHPFTAAATIHRWLSGSYASLRSERARARLTELIPLLVDRIGWTETPDATLAACDRFLEGFKGGSRLYSRLCKSPRLVALLVLTMQTAPRLADILSLHPYAIDALLDPAFFEADPGYDILARALLHALEASNSFEDFIDRSRMAGWEQSFLIGARVLSGTMSSARAREAFTRLADLMICTMYATVETKFRADHGRLRQQDMAVLALGKLGGREMTATSDLDLTVIYQFDPDHPESDGKRPLYGAQYFSRLTQRLIGAITAQTNFGSLYAVDMRLRPSGRAGPIAVQIDGFRSYQQNEAWIWEHMALTRARIVSASPLFASQLNATIRDILRRERDPALVAREVVNMRRMIAEQKGETGRWNLKYAAGGLIDVEFIAQYLQLIHAAKYPDILETSTIRALEKAGALGVLNEQDAEVLARAAGVYNDLLQVLRLCQDTPFDAQTAGVGLPKLLARTVDVPDIATLDQYLTEIQRDVRACFLRILGAGP
jgi:glutamate-ammonia-ligase adenylyltransferase